MNIIEALKWRYATKKFNPNKAVSEDNIEYLKETIRLAASSYGLQAYKVLIIRDKDLKNKLRPVSYNQSQISDASHLFVFCSFTNVGDEEVDDFMKLNADVTKKPIEALEGFSKHLKGDMAGKKPENMFIWTAKQTYIALANLLTACGERKIDACPMEGIIPAKYDEILELNKKGLTATVACCVGYRHPDDKYQHVKKVRKHLGDLFEDL
jgi:nitroreductase